MFRSIDPNTHPFFNIRGGNIFIEANNVFGDLLFTTGKSILKLPTLYMFNGSILLTCFRLIMYFGCSSLASIIWVQRATSKGCSSCIICLSATRSHWLGGDSPVSDSSTPAVTTAIVSRYMKEMRPPNLSCRTNEFFHSC